MTQNKKNTTEIQRALQSGIPEMQLGAIAKVREGEDPEHIAPLLETFCLLQTEEEVRHEILRLLVDAKYTALIPAIEQRLIEGKLPAELQASLISICWQNSMDFSPLIGYFTEQLASPSLQVVVESVTALEVAMEYARPEVLKGVVKRIKELGNEKLPEENRVFIQEMGSLAAQAYQQAANAQREAKRSATEGDEGCQCDH
ncbi:MAG: hypothetical protein CSA97_02305 [Bacteroidetes bacterium]|nr:MAG: hypothetical protein CSA97_02305 [Bacteroidota bacterium]